MGFSIRFRSHPLAAYRISTVSFKNLTEWCMFAVYALIYELFCAILTIWFAEVGIIIGAISGAFVGLKSKSGCFLHGATVGALMGCLLSIKTLNALISAWHSDDRAVGFVPLLIEFTANLLKKSLTERRWSPTTPVPGEAQETAVQVGQDAVPIAHDEVPSAGFRCKRLGKNSRKKIAKIRLTDRNIVETTWNGNCCAICLQDFQMGDVACRLPECHHTFHAACIGRWFIEHDSCPLCRLHL